MKFIVVKSKLLQALQDVQNVVNARSTLPVLSNTLITADEKGIKLTTTDLDITVQSFIEADIEETGITTLPVRRLANIVRELPDGNIDFEVDENDVASLKCKSSFMRIIGMSKEEFPPVPSPEGRFCYHLDQGEFREMLRKTLYAASTDETRHVLNGVLMSFKEGKLTVVATDGRRLALVDKDVDFPVEAEQNIILPSKSVNELVHILGDSGDLMVYAQPNQIMFEFGGVLMSSKLINGEFPDYTKVIPSGCEHRVMIEREQLITALRRVSLVTTDKSNSTKLTFLDNILTIVTNTPDVGEARETIPIKYDGEEISIIFNPEYMISPLKTLTADEVAIELTDGLSPGVLKSDVPFIYVLMPLRVS